MFRRLRTRIHALLSMPSQLSTCWMLVEHVCRQQQETNDLLRELTVSLGGRLPTTPSTPPLDLRSRAALAPPTTPPTPSTPPSRRRRTDADVVVASRAFLLEQQEAQRLREAQTVRENQRIV